MQCSQDGKKFRECMDNKWLDLRVFYVRLSSCPLGKTPEFLSVRLLPRDYSVGLEVNGEHVSPSKIAGSVLRRDRIDGECKEVTYVSTDNVRTRRPLRFEVYHKDVLLVCGKLDRLERGTDDFVEDKELGWSMDCYAAAGFGDWVLLRGSPELRPWTVLAPVMEVYLAGCSSGSPLVFAKRLQLVCRRKAQRLCLDAIPEDEDTEKPCERRANMDPLFQLTDNSGNEDVDEKVRPTFSNFNPDDEFIEEEDGELSWFNAVTVGVGIGLGICLAVGVGVGLLVITYQKATKTVRRRWL